MDAFVIDAVRSPMISAQPAGLASDMNPMELVSQTVTELLARAGVEPGDLDRVLIQSGSSEREQFDNAAHVAWPTSGLPTRIPAITIDRWCGTGQLIMHRAVHSVAAGAHGAVVVVGVEPLPRGGESADSSGKASVTCHRLPRLHPQAMAAEVLAAKWGLDRERLDAYTARSYQRASEVQRAGEFTAEVVPIEWPASQGGPSRRIVNDETIEHEVTVESLGRLQPIFDPAAMATRYPDLTWSITEGNSARPAVGAAAVLIMNRARSSQLSVTPRARFRRTAVAVGDETMPLAAPLRVTEKVLAGARMEVSDVDHVEVGEEFASVPLAWLTEFGISPDLFNPRGGSLALGHARGCAGIRQLTTMLNALESTGGRFGLQTMNADANKAYAAVLECC